VRAIRRYLNNDKGGGRCNSHGKSGIFRPQGLKSGGKKPGSSGGTKNAPYSKKRDRYVKNWVGGVKIPQSAHNPNVRGGGFRVDGNTLGKRGIKYVVEGEGRERRKLDWEGEKGGITEKKEKRVEVKDTGRWEKKG